MSAKDSLTAFPYLYLISNGKSKTIKLPKNITDNWIIKQAEKLCNSAFTNLQSVFQNIKVSGNIYYTSFGFSYITWFKDNETFKKENETIKNTLVQLGIKFTNEFSNKHWVYRYKISTEKSNLELINNL